MKQRDGNNHLRKTWPVLEKRLLKFIVKFKAAHCGDSPNAREMQAALGAGSSKVLGALKRLEAQGHIKRNRTRIAVTGAEWIAEK